MLATTCSSTKTYNFPLDLPGLGSLLNGLRTSRVVVPDNAVFRGENWKEVLKVPIYGRVCLTEGENRLHPPTVLSSAPGRKTAFVFGPETACAALVCKKPYDLLLHLGFLPEYIHLKACIQKSKYWIVLLSGALDTPQSPIVPATWGGLESFLRTYYPAAAQAVLAHWHSIRTRPVEFFEREADFKFIAALSDPAGPLYMGYERFVSLPKPQTAWQARLFLYCELRILELYAGDGRTQHEDGTAGDKEYISTNYVLDSLDRDKWLAIPLHVDVPQEVKEMYAGISYK